MKRTKIRKHMWTANRMEQRNLNSNLANVIISRDSVVPWLVLFKNRTDFVDFVIFSCAVKLFLCLPFSKWIPAKGDQSTATYLYSCFFSYSHLLDRQRDSLIPLPDVLTTPPQFSKYLWCSPIILKTKKMDLSERKKQTRCHKISSFLLSE